MFMRRQIIILLFLMGNVFTTSAQSSGSGTSANEFNMANIRTDIIPHSPEVEAFTKYDVMPVTLYTGLPQVSVPIYEIKTPHFHIPISLSYNHNGYKPNEDASWVGLGWSIQGAGGVITKVIKGLPDDQVGIQHYDSYLVPTVPFPRQWFLKELAEGRRDGEPDIYIFNFNGHSGKFTIINDKVYQFPDQQLIIKPVYATATDYSTHPITSFEIIDELGDKYQFSTTETTHQTHEFNNPYVPPYTSAWHLTQVASADGTETIDYSYSEYYYKLPMTFQESLTAVYGVGSNPGVTWKQNNYAGGFISDAKLISRIRSKTVTIDFIKGDVARIDMANSSNVFPLKKIVVNPSLGLSPLKAFELTHSYFGNNKKLKLISVTEKNLYNPDLPFSDLLSEDGFTGKKYKFDYDESHTFPPNYSKGVDKWGYYNGGDENAQLIPYDYAVNFQLPGRVAQYPYASLGLLKKVTWPTGGTTVFTWEKNQTGGIKVNALPPTDASAIVSVTANANEATESSTPFSIHVEQNVTVTYASIVEDNSNYSPDYTLLKIFRGTGIHLELVYSSPPVPAGQAMNVDHVNLDAGDYVVKVYCQPGIYDSYGRIDYKNYSVINSLADGPGLRIKQVSNFDDPASADPSTMRLYEYNGGVAQTNQIISGHSLSTHQCMNGVDETLPNLTPLTTVTYSAYYSPPLSSLLDQQFFYKQVTEINRDKHTNGKTVYQFKSYAEDFPEVLMEEKTSYQYNNYTYLPGTDEKYSYELIPKINFSGLSGWLSENVRSSCTYGANPFPGVDPCGPNQVFEFYSAGTHDLNSNYKILTTEEQTTYDENGQNPLLKTTNYNYQNPYHHFPTSKVVTDSKGNQYTTWMSYPFDYQFNTCGLPSDLLQNFVNQTSTAIQNVVTCHEDAFAATGLTVLNNYNAAIANYNACLNTSIANTSTPWKKAVLQMQKNNIISPVIEELTTINKAGNDYLLAAKRNEYEVTTSGGIVLRNIKQAEIKTPFLLSAFQANPDNYLKDQVHFDYNTNLTLVQQNKNNDIPHTYIWDYNDTHPVADVQNAGPSEVAYTSFETSNTGGFIYPNTVTNSQTAPTGYRVYTLSGGYIKKENLPQGNYVVSLWATNTGVTVNGAAATTIGTTINGWTYYEYQLANVNQATINGTGSLDELRLYPQRAKMATYTYVPEVGISAQCDASNRITYYSYDVAGRLALVKDQYRNILKKYCYNYYGQPEDCGFISTAPVWQPTGLTRCKPCPQNNAFNTNIQEHQEWDVNPNSSGFHNSYQWIEDGPSSACMSPSDWQDDGLTQCETEGLCDDGTPLYTGNQLKLQRDVNPCSATFGQARWVFNVHNCTTCPASPIWQFTSAACQVNSGGQNTGVKVITETNIETCSSNYGATRTRTVLDRVSCPLANTCSISNCTGNNKKCVNNVCETGTPVVVSYLYAKWDGEVYSWKCTYKYCFSDGTVSSYSWDEIHNTYCPIGTCASL